MCGDGLMIYRNESNNFLDAVYGDSLLRNVHVLVGKTGSGKTNVLQMIGMDEYSRDEKDEYLFIFKENVDRESFIMELHNIDLNIPVRSEQPYNLDTNTGLFRLKLKDSRVISLIPIRPSDVRDCLIVNCFDKFSFSAYPYFDEHSDGFHNSQHFITRIISPYGRTNVGIACEWIQRYLSGFPVLSVKRKSSLIIKSHNWANRDSSPVDVDLLKTQYWTYEEIDGMFAEGFSQKLVDSSQKRSVKQKFLHDLLSDYALYLREYLEGFCKEEIDRDAEMGVFDETVGLSEKANPWHSPDYWGTGSVRHLIKRIEWLAMVIDYSSDEEMFPDGKGLVWQISSDIIDIYNILAKLPDKYFTATTFTIPIMDIEMGEGKPMEDLFERMTGYRADDLGLFTKELLPYQITCLSSGEYQFAKVLGAVDEYCVRLKLRAQGHQDYIRPDFILLLDEPETYMHPELARRFMFEMDNILQKHSKDSNIQVIMTTHSPFMLSDITSCQVTKLDYDENGYCMVLPESEQTFAAGIHSIMANEFFLDFSIGEFSRRRLTDLLQQLKLIINKNTIDQNDSSIIRTAKTITPNIGDPLLRRYFETLLEIEHDTSEIQ